MMKLKKIFPIIFLILCFLGVLVAQMSINGSQLSASNLQKNKEKYSIFENIFDSLKLETSNNQTYQLRKIKQPIVVLNFWASWCRPCIAEFKTLNQFIEKYSTEKVLVIGINNDDETPIKAIKKAEDEYKLKFESVADQESDIASKFFIDTIPASIVFHNGKVIHYVNKEFDFMKPDFLSLIDKALKE